MTETTQNPPPRKINHTFQRRTGLIITGLGLMLFILGAQPGWFGLNISEAIGFVQIGVFSFGLVMIGVGGSLALGSVWPSHWRSISADFGLRLVWSGVVLALISALADIIGLGTRPLSTSFIFFGYWQARGVLIGQTLMFIGFAMMIPKKRDVPPPLESNEENTSEEDGDEQTETEQTEPEANAEATGTGEEEEKEKPAEAGSSKIQLDIE